MGHGASVPRGRFLVKRNFSKDEQQIAVSSILEEGVMRNSPGRRWSAWGLIVALGASQAAPAAWAAPTDTTLRQAASAQNPDTVQRLQSGLEEPSPAQPAASPAPRGIVSGSDLVVGQDYGRANDLNCVVFSRAVTVHGAPFELPGGITVNPNR